MKDILPTTEQLQFAQELTFLMGNRFNSYAEATDIRGEYDLPDLVDAIAAVAGQAVIAYNAAPNYFRAQNQTPRYVPKGLSINRGTEAVGTLQGVVDIPQRVRDGQRRRICLQVGPLAMQADPAWRAFYKSRGRLDQYYHPFSDANFARRMVWIPLDGLGSRKLQFPSTPLESTHGTVPVNAWQTINLPRKPEQSSGLLRGKNPT